MIQRKLRWGLVLLLLIIGGSPGFGQGATFASERNALTQNSVVDPLTPRQEPTREPGGGGDNFETLGVIGSEDRQAIDETLDPYNSIVSISFDGGFVCTGFLISPLHVMTAAECVYDVTTATNVFTSADTVTVAPGVSGSTNFNGVILAESVSIPADWINTADINNAKSNFAVIELTSPFPADLVKFRLDDTVTFNTYQSRTYTLSGYPGSGDDGDACNGGECNGTNQYAASDLPFTPVNYNYGLDEMWTRIDASLGQRGSPIFYDDGNGNYTVAGIYTSVSTVGENAAANGSYNKGPLISGNVTGFLNASNIPFDGPGAQNTVNVTTPVVNDSSATTLTNAVNSALGSGNPATVFIDPLPGGADYTYGVGSDSGNGTLLPNINGKVSIVARVAPATIAFTGGQNDDLLFARVGNGGELIVSGLSINGFINTGGGGVADNEGGAIRNAGTFAAVESAFVNNVGDLGAALFNATGATATLIRPSFEGNISNVSGGGIYNEGTLTIYDDFGTLDKDDYFEEPPRESFFDNSASGSGGGIYNEGTLLLQDTFFYDNTVGNASTAGQGAGVYNAASGTVTVNGSTLWNNASTKEGGAFYNAGVLTIDDTELTENKAGPLGVNEFTDEGSGAALFNTAGGDVTITGSSINTNNSYRGSEQIANDPAVAGGAIATAGDVTITDTIIESNAIVYDADAITIGGADDVDADVVSRGAAIYVNGNGSPSVSVQDSCITGNLSNGFQGILNESNNTVTADSVWWGDEDGPTPPGADINDPTQQEGDQISNNVTVTNAISDRDVDFYEDCTLSALRATNDGFVNRIALQTLGADPNLSTLDSTNNPDDPQPVTADINADLCQVTNRSIWYSYTPPIDVTVDVQVNDYEGTTPARGIVSVWDATDPLNPRDSLEKVNESNYCAFADPVNGGNATISDLALTANTTYYIMVGSYQGGGGISQLRITPEVPELIAPQNNADVSEAFPTYEFTAVSYAEDYRLVVTRDSDDSVAVDVVVPTTACDANTCSFQPSQGLLRGVYNWTVAANYRQDASTVIPYESTQNGFEITRYVWDVVENNVVNQADVDAVIARLGFVSPPNQVDLADVNGDGRVTPTDVAEVINRLGPVPGS